MYMHTPSASKICFLGHDHNNKIGSSWKKTGLRERAKLPISKDMGHPQVQPFR